MDRYQETFETWNKVAKLYQEKFMNLDFYNTSYDFFCNSIKQENAKVLEIGCGPGNITQYLLNKKPDLDIYGIDVAPNMVELAQKNNPSARFEEMDCRTLDNLQTKFNAVISGFCLPYLSQKDCQKLIADSSELLHDNGIIYLSFVEGDPLKSDFQIGSSGNRTYFYFHRLEEIEQHLRANQFEKIRSFKVPYPKTASEIETHTIIIAKKKPHF